MYIISHTLNFILDSHMSLITVLAGPGMETPTLHPPPTVPPEKATNLTNGQAITSWIFTNILFALLPFALAMIIKWFSSGAVGKGLKYFKDGELFFFSSTLAAAAMGKIKELDLRGEPSADAYIYYALLLIILFSTLCYGVVVLLRTNPSIITPPAPPPPPNQLSKGEKNIAISSIAVALATIILSFIAFYQGGFK